MSTEIKTSVLIFLLRAIFVDAHAGLSFAETKKPAFGGLSVCRKKPAAQAFFVSVHKIMRYRKGR